MRYSDTPISQELIYYMGGSPGELRSFSNLSVTSPTSQLILQPFRRFTYVKAHSPALPSLYLRHISFNTSVASPTSQFILQPFFRFSCVTSSSLHSPGEVALLILQPFRHFTYITTHSPTHPSLYLRHSSFSNPSVASPTSQFILQPFFRFSCVRSSSLNSHGEPPMPSIIAHLIWLHIALFFIFKTQN